MIINPRSHPKMTSPCRTRFGAMFGPSTAVCLGWLVVFAGVAPADESVYDARINQGEILTPLPGDAPRINGPTIYGCRPDKEFVHRIPCQGQRPMTFSVEGLPEGLKLDAERGVIRGRTPAEKGRHEMTLRATNAHGSDARPFRLVVGDKLALTPPTGYSSWGGHMLDIDEETVLDVLDVFVNRGLADAGFQYICIDDGWGRIDPDIYAGNLEGFEDSGFHTEAARQWCLKQFRRMGDFDPASVVGKTRDEEGRPLPNHHFPDMKGMVDKIHAHGLRAGIYSSPGLVTCQIQMGSWGHESIDARQFAEWGFDFLKYDRCGIKFRVFKAKAEGEEYGLERLWQPMVRHLREQDRDVIYNLCQYGMHEPWTWAPDWDMQSWRIGGDLNGHTDSYYKQAMRIAKNLREYSKPGQWSDPDFMYIHKIKHVDNKGGPAREISLTTNQRYQFVSLWSMICAPFFFACDIHEIDEFTVRLVGNAEFVNVNQDELGEVGTVVRETEDEMVMTKPLADGSTVLAVFNRDEQKEAVVPVSWEELGLEGPQAIRDLWRHRELGNRDKGLKVRLSPSGCAVLRLKQS
jgi:alpha-galactosidase